MGKEYPEEKMIGRRFNSLTVLWPAPNISKNKKHYMCRCNCGRMKIAYGSQVRAGLIKSCGCLRNGYLK